MKLAPAKPGAICGGDRSYGQCASARATAMRPEQASRTSLGHG